MKYVKIFFRFGLILLALILVGAKTVAAAPLFTAHDDCTANGGRWVDYNSNDGQNGYCNLPVGNSITLATCANDNEALEQFYDTGSLAFANCYPADGSDGNDPTSCQYTLGGVWANGTTENTCTVSHDYIGDCPGQITIYSYDPNTSTLIGFTCGGTASGPNGNLFKYFVKDDDGSGELSLMKPQGDFQYFAGTCSGKCIINHSIPERAANSLPADALTTLYVRLVDDFGESTTGFYIVCFDLGSLSNPVIYRFTGGIWVAQIISIGGGNVCTSATSDGVFALGGT